jgi:Carboxypeptidase regulatory-like domain/TonB-dependent Receptor Plug Domain
MLMKMGSSAKRFPISLFACCLALLMVVSASYGQSAGTGALSGTVSDPSGRTVPNATVIATDLGTGQTRTEMTGPDGVYKFSLLPPGNYSVKFSAAGFKTSDVTSVTVNVTETPTLDQALEVGAVTEQVTVQSNVVALQTESSTLGTTVTSSTITALPLANRNYTQILGLSAGTNVGVSDATSLGRGTQDMSVNGMDPGQNNFQMDGVAVNNIANSGSSNDGTIYTGIPVPSPDAIQEFKVQTSTYDASYGRNPGGNVNVLTKSGTNNFHGSGFEFLRNSVLNANDFFYDKTPQQPHQVLDQNQYGGTVGGPIKKDKLFFFLSYQGTGSKNGVSVAGFTPGVGLPPIPNESRGTCPAGVVPLASCDATAQTFITDVSNAICGPNAFGGPALTGPAASCGAFQGPPNISIQGLHILQLKNANGGYYIPTPLADSSCSAATLICNFSDPAIYRENQGILNADYVINSKETLSTRYLYTHNPQIDTLNGDIPGTPETVIWGNHDAVLKLTSILTNNLVNEARVSFQRNVASASNTYPADSTPADLGITPLSPSQNLPPTMLILAQGVPHTLFGTLVPFNGPTNQLQFADQISWSHGRHSFRAGFEHEDTRWPLIDNGFTKGFMFFGDLNDVLVGQASPAPSVGAPGNVFECLFCIKGYPQAVTHYYHLHNNDAFVQDDWKLNSRLTFNLGLRWEYDGMLSDSLGNLTNVWLSELGPNSALPTSLAAALADPTNSLAGYVVPTNFRAHYGTPPPGVSTAPNNLSLQKHAPYTNFAPRFGFAWQPLQSSRLVVRGGAGIFYDRVSLDRFVHAVEQGNPYAVTYDYTFETPRDLAASIANPFPALPFVPLPANPSIGFTARWFDPATGQGSGLTLPFLTQTVHTPLIRQYNLGIQYELAPSWILEVGYVGSSGINLTDIYHNYNTAVLATPTNSLSGLCTGTAPVVCNTSANASARVPYLGFSPTGLTGTGFDGISNYNSLQVTVRHQFSHGLTMQAAYTWSKSLTDLSGGVANGNDASDLGQQYGRAWFNRPQRFVVNYSYDLPFGKGMHGFEGKVLAGWNVSGVTIAQAGDAITFVDATGGAAYGTQGNTTTGYSRAQLCPGVTDGQTLTSGSVESRLGTSVPGDKGYFNTSAFCAPPGVPYGDATATGFGNSGPGAVLGPSQFNTDFSIIKNTQITERLKVQFRSDFYNAFNHPEFADPTGTNADPTYIDVSTRGTGSTFGSIAATIANPRLIQFGLRFVF